MGDAIMGCTTEDGEPKMAGGAGGPNNWGKQNDGGVVG